MKYTVIIFLIFITSCRSQNISDQDKYYQEIHKILNVSFGENTKVIMPNKFSFSNRIDLSKNHLYDSLLVSYKKNKLILASLLKNKDDETVYNKQLWFENKNLTIDKLNIKLLNKNFLLVENFNFDELEKKTLFVEPFDIAIRGDMLLFSYKLYGNLSLSLFKFNGKEYKIIATRRKTETGME